MWIIVAVFAASSLSLMFALIIARVLGTISREVSALQEGEVDGWVFAPLTREAKEGARVSEDEFAAV
jgi:hypothetical protein